MLIPCSAADFNPLSASPTKWSNTLKQFVGNLPKNCLSVFDHFINLALKGLRDDINVFIDIVQVNITLQSLRRERTKLLEGNKWKTRNLYKTHHQYNLLLIMNHQLAQFGDEGS